MRTFHSKLVTYLEAVGRISTMILIDPDIPAGRCIFVDSNGPEVARIVNLKPDL